MKETPLMQIYQFRSRSIVAYYKKESKSSFRSVSRQQSIDNFKKQTTYSGIVTEGSQKRLTRAIENLVQIAQLKPLSYKHYFDLDDKSKGYVVRNCTFKVNFVTLTLYSFGNRVPGKEAHKNCLEPLLRWMRNKGMTAYVWKAELQMNRKDCHQLHYHLTTDVYIDCFELRDKWNELQRKAGYLDYFFDKFGHWNPNSTDVHATHNKRNLVAYLKKKIVRYSDKKKYQHLRSRYLIAAEMAKTVQNQETIEGKIWDSSYNIKTAFYECQAYANITKRLATACFLGEVEKKEFERCTVYELKQSRWGNRYDASTYLCYPESLFYQHHIQRMREFELIREKLKPDISMFSTS